MCFFRQSLTAFNCYNLQYFFTKFLSLDNVVAFYLKNDLKTHPRNSYQCNH